MKKKIFIITVASLAIITSLSVVIYSKKQKLNKEATPKIFIKHFDKSVSKIYKALD